MSETVPEGWEVTKLGEHTNRFYQGINTVADKVVYQIDGIPILQAKHITSGVVTFGGAKFMDAVTYEKYRDKFQPRENDILFTNIGTIGKSVLVQKPSEYLIAWNIFLIGLNAETDPKYFNLFLQKLDSDQYFEDLMTGNATKFVNKSNLYDVPFLTPPLPEQKKIASILTSVDEVIENTQKQIDKLQDLKKASMNDLLIKGIGHTEFKDSELGRIPKSWEVISLRNVCKVRQGLQIPIENRFTQEGDNRYPYLTVAWINSGFDTNKAEFIGDPKKSVILKQDEFVVGRTGAVGQVFDGLECVFHNNFFAVSLIISSINKNFLKHFLKWHLTQDLLLKLAGSTTIPDLNHDDFYSVNLRLPPLKEQQRIISILDHFDLEISTKEKKLAQTQSLKKSLMQDLLTGKVRVKVN